MSVPVSVTNHFPVLDQNLRVNFARNPRSFKLPQYVLMVDWPRQIQYYTLIEHLAGLHIPGRNKSHGIWADGNPRPSGLENRVSFKYPSARLDRYWDGFPYGVMSVRNATFDVINTNAAYMAQKAMTRRTLWAKYILDNTSGAGSATFSSLGGGFIGAGTLTAPYFKKALEGVLSKLKLATGGVAQKWHLKVIVPPVAALAFAGSEEFHTYTAQQSGSDAERRRGHGDFGIDDEYHGFSLVVEDTVVYDGDGLVKAGTIDYAASNEYVYDDDTIYVVARMDVNGGAGMTGPNLPEMVEGR